MLTYLVVNHRELPLEYLLLQVELIKVSFPFLSVRHSISSSLVYDDLAVAGQSWIHFPCLYKKNVYLVHLLVRFSIHSSSPTSLYPIKGVSVGPEKHLSAQYSHLIIKLASQNAFHKHRVIYYSRRSSA